MDPSDYLTIKTMREDYWNYKTKIKVQETIHTNIKGIVLFGPSEVGKSLAVELLFNSFERKGKLFDKPGELDEPWFNGLNADKHDAILLNDV